MYCAHSAQVVSACWRALGDCAGLWVGGGVVEGGVDVAAGPRHLLRRSPCDKAPCALHNFTCCSRYRDDSESAKTVNVMTAATMVAMMVGAVCGCFAVVGWVTVAGRDVSWTPKTKLLCTFNDSTS